MTRIILTPDGNEVYSAPVTVKDANEWLKRVNATHLKFGTCKGKAVLKDANTNRVYLLADKISDLCYFLAFEPLQMRRFRINGYDWYRPDKAAYKMGTVTVRLYS